jgi:predicted kinase
MQPALIIINGLPATGKTTIGKALAKEFDISFLTKDSVKEFLFDNLGIGDREWSRRLGAISSVFLYEVADQLLTAGKSLIVESDFHKDLAEPEWKKVIEKHKPGVLEIYCFTEKDVRRARFEERNKSGNRHRGHVDAVNYLSESVPEPLDIYAPLMVGDFLNVDTTKANDQTTKDVVEEVRKRLEL